jgi:hypothetical protein
MRALTFVDQEYFAMGPGSRSAKVA